MAPGTVADVYAAYERRKTDQDGNRLLDFDDLILVTAAILEDNHVVAEEFRDRYRSFVVDEYQDVTPLQQQLLNAWLGDRDDLTVVGTRTRPSIRSPAPPRTTCSTSRAASRTPPSSGCSATTAPLRRSWRSPTR